MSLIRRNADGRFQTAHDDYLVLGDADPIPETGSVILPLPRLAIEIEEMRLDGRPLGVLVTVDDDLSQLAPFLSRVAVVALRFDKYRDGRSYSTAALLRGRYGFKGELRAVGDVLVEEATQMIRCGFDAFAPADDSPSQAWEAKASLHRHVYQAALDGRAPIYAERASKVTAA
jgi:uncharacterized protein (DUF934 family)